MEREPHAGADNYSTTLAYASPLIKDTSLHPLPCFHVLMLGRPFDCVSIGFKRVFGSFYSCNLN